MSVKLNNNYVLQCAKDFTSLAIENKIIHATHDPVETAKNVTDFFNKVYDSLSGKDSTNGE